MQQKLYSLIVLTTLIAIGPSFTAVAVAQQARGLEITTAAICREVVDLEPMDAATSFEASVGKLYCLTHVTGAQGATEIHHIWYLADSERAVVTLPVQAASWRTYSSKIIQPHEIGAWRVDVLDREGEVLKAVHFEITPSREPAPPGG